MALYEKQQIPLYSCFFRVFRIAEIMQICILTYKIKNKEIDKILIIEEEEEEEQRAIGWERNDSKTRKINNLI